LCSPKAPKAEPVEDDGAEDVVCPLSQSRF